MLIEVSAGTLKSAESLSMDELQRRFMAIRPSLAPATKDQYDWLWSKLKPHIGSIAVRKLRTEDLDHACSAITATGVGPNTTRKVAKHARALLAQAITWALVGRNVAIAAKPPREVPFNVSPPTPQQRIALVDAAYAQEPQFGALVYLAVTTGARRGELGGLRWLDVDLKNATVRIVHQADADGTLRPTKTMHQRNVPIDVQTVDMLKRHRSYCVEIAAECGVDITNDSFVFSAEPGNTLPYRVDGITQRFERLRDATGVPCLFHDLRHAAATTLLSDAISPVVVAERLGMSVEVLLATYGHSDTEQNERAAAASALRR
jgi:integrase